MVAIPTGRQIDQTLAAADAALVEISRKQKRRDYLGMSALGDDCSRRLWYNLHDPIAEDFEAATLKRFADGHASEQVIIDRIRLVPGVTLINIDPDTGNQYRYTDFDGKLAGHPDGFILGLLQAPATWCIFEAKCSQETTFNKLIKAKAEKGEKSALQAWNGTYWAQAQLYMGYADLTRHWLVCCTPGARDWTSVRTDFDPVAFERLKDKAKRIIESPAPLAKLSNDPNWYACKWCQYHERCHGAPA